MKYRIKQIDDKFYPQYRRFFIWFYFTEHVVMDSYDKVSYESLSYAEAFIKRLIILNETSKIKPTVIIHNYE
ncbi:MAG: hypothetical protein PHF21_02715 [Bacilli bacterium]|nr:hypothetical protein [Bacilli bacterium]